MPGTWLVSIPASFAVMALLFGGPRPERYQTERAGNDLAGVLSAVFKRAAANPESIPDGQLLKSGVVLRQEIGSYRAKIPSAAVAGLESWVIRSAQELQQEADDRGEPTFFVTVKSVRVKGNEARIEWGTDTFLPKKLGNVLKACCAIALDRYVRQENGWVFRRRLRELYH